MSENKEESKDKKEQSQEPAKKEETAFDKKVTDNKGRDFAKPRWFKKDGEV